MKVVAIDIFLIKGMKATSVTTAKVLERGFEDDRRYMLVDKNNTFISQRSHPQICTFVPTLNNGIISVKAGENQFDFSKDSDSKTIVEATLFDNMVLGTEVSSQANTWFSDQIGEEVKLLKMTPQNIRQKLLIKNSGITEVSFADGYPYLLIGTASLDNLNSKLDEPLPMNRFRGNIIVETTEPHVEDSFENFMIGNVLFRNIKPCARCKVPTTDQETGEVGKEPLKTLSTYRKNDKKIYFGTNLISISKGSIHINDELSHL